MAVRLRGCIHVTGENDSGKTTFAVECGAQPEDMIFVAGEPKSVSVIQNVESIGGNFGIARNLVEETKGMKELVFHKHCLDFIRGIPAGKYQALVWDNWKPFEDTFQPYVATHMNEFRDNWSPKGDIKGAQVWQSSFDYETTVIQELLSKVPLVILTTQIKEDKMNGIRTGKMIAEGKRPLQVVTVMRLWLRRNPRSPKPIGLVLKRPCVHQKTDKGIRTVNVLPYKLDPCTWDRIAEYFAEPMGDRAPTAEETPTEYELSVIQGVLTADQMEVMRIVAQTGGRDLEADEQQYDEHTVMVMRAKEMRDQHKSAPVIAKELGLTVPEVARLLAE